MIRPLLVLGAAAALYWYMVPDSRQRVADAQKLEQMITDAPGYVQNGVAAAKEMARSIEKHGGKQ